MLPRPCLIRGWRVLTIFYAQANPKMRWFF